MASSSFSGGSKLRARNDLREEMGGRRYILDTFGAEKPECKEARGNYEDKKR